MTADLLTFPTDGSAEIPLEPEATVELELEVEAPLELEMAPDEPAASVPVVSTGLMEVLPADFRLPALIKFIPNPALRIAAEEAARYALSIAVQGADGLQRADLALAALRTSLKGIEEHLEEPVTIANALHKRLTTVRAEWQASGKAALETVGQRVYTEQKRLDALAAEDRRKAQEEADRQAREAARLEAASAEQAKAPAPIVEELKRQAETVTAPPVSVPASAPPALRNSTVTTTWKCRIVGTPGSDEPNPDVANLSIPQRHQVFALLKSILDGSAPLAAIALDWSYLNKRAKADKGALSIPGFEAFEEGGVRAKSTRGR